MEISLLSARLKTRLGLTGTDKDALLDELIISAEDACKAYIGRESVPDGCETAVVRLASVEYNRLGMEGETSHSEGGVSVSVDALPEDVKALLRPFRLGRTV